MNQRMSKYRLKYYYQRNTGLAAARNLGIKKSKGKIIVFIDDDCIAKQNWLRNLVTGFEGKIVGVGGRIESYKPKTVAQKYAQIFLYDHKEAVGGVKEPPHLGTNSAFLKRTLFKVGLFDENLRCGEDVDLSWRLYFAGYNLIYQKKAVIYHRDDKTVFQLARKIYHYGQARKKNLEMHKENLEVYMGPSKTIVKNFILRDFRDLFSWSRRLKVRYRKIDYFGQSGFWFKGQIIMLDILLYFLSRLGILMG